MCGTATARWWRGSIGSWVTLVRREGAQNAGEMRRVGRQTRTLAVKG
jgi:hypothetical protein